MTARSPAAVLERLPAGVVALASAWLQRLVAVQFVDRAAALGGQAFTALIPLFIVYDAVVPQIDGRDFAEGVIDRFDLHGSAAASVHQALTAPGETSSGFGILGVALVVISSLSFARALQRLYELSFRLPALGGVRGTPATVLWLALIPAFVTLREVVDAILPGLVGTVVWLGIAAGMWTVTPFILLARRVDWRRLVPTGVLSAVAMSALGVASLIWMPHTISESADRYGLIGLAFALLSWLVGAGFVLVGAATGGAVVAERGWRT